MTIAARGASEVATGVAAVLGAAAPPVIITDTIGTGRWNDTLHVIEIDPKVLNWPAECQQFLGAHEAAHVQQKPMGRRWIINALSTALSTYLAALVVGLIRLGMNNELLSFAIETTCYAALLLTGLLEVVTFHSRRREHRADRIAAAAVGVAGLIQWRRIAERDRTIWQRAMLAANAAIGLRTHPSWRRRVAAVNRTTKAGRE